MRSLSLLTLTLLPLATRAFAQQAPAPQPAPPPPAGAPAPPPRPKATLQDLDARVTRLSADVTELKKATVEVPTLQQAVNDLTAQLAAIKQDVETFRRVNASAGDERARLDGLEARLTELGQQVSSVRASVQAQGAPESGAPFGSATYRDGFLLATEDGAYALRIKGYVQFRYQLRTPEGDAGDPEESSFLLRRARISLEGNVFSPRLTFKVQPELAVPNAQLLDYYIEGKVHDMVSVRAGQYKSVFSRQFYGGEENQIFLERAVASDEFRYDRELGVMAIGRPHEKVEVFLAVHNGAGPNVRANDNVDPLLIARVNGAVLGKPWKPEEGDFDNTPSPALMLGAAGSFENTPVPGEYGYLAITPAAQPITNVDVDGDGDRDNVRVMQLELDASFRWRGLGVEGEAYFRRESWGTIGDGQTPTFSPKKSYQGGFVQATYFLVPERYLLGARAAFAEVSPLAIGGRRRPVATCTFGGTSAPCTLPVSDLRTELSVLASYFRHRHGIELTAMYSFLDWASQDGADPSDAGEHRFLIETQLAF